MNKNLLGWTQHWLFYRSGYLNRFDCNALMFKCIISHSSTKSLVPLLHKFTIWKLDLFFPLFWQNRFANIAVYLLTCLYFRRMEKVSDSLWIPWQGMQLSHALVFHMPKPAYCIVIVMNFVSLCSLLSC